MKLLVFSPGYPPRIGGLESHAAEFNLHLAEQPEITHITVFTPRLPASSLAEESPHHNITVLRFPAIDIVPNYPFPKVWTREFWRMWQRVWCEDADLSISRTRFFLTSLMAGVYAFGKRKKWIHIEHGSEFVQLSSSFSSVIARIYDETFGRLVFRASTQNVVISKAVDRFVARFTSRPSTLIYRGIEFDRIDAIPTNYELRKKYPDKVIVMVVGRLYKWKGIAHTIEAVKQLSPEVRAKMVFVVVGDGEDFVALKAKAGEGVVMLGGRPRDEAIALVKSAAIYVHSSLPGGGLSTSLLEAMAAGCAIIASPHEGANEVVSSENGILIAESRADLIASALTSYLADPGLVKKMGKAGQAAVKQTFSWQTTARSYVALFKSLTS